MSNCRYIRMADNDHGWKRPHGGRKGGDDYVGTQGFGHEDWNFANDVWKDGRYHLYLTSTPKGFDESSFNFVLGAHSRPVPMIVGFVENAVFGLSKLPKKVLLRRAEEVFALSEEDSLGPLYDGLSVEQIAKILKRDAGEYRVSVAPQDLRILAQPVPMPADIYKVSHPGYRALRMTDDQYAELKERVLTKDTKTSVDRDEDPSFPEGRLVEKWHRSRERSGRLVDLAKQKFMDEHDGRLFCEACTLDPEERFSSAALRGKIIEAHHDVPLSDERHEGATKVSDLRMLCPTCHEAIHAIRPWITVEYLRKRLSSAA